MVKKTFKTPLYGTEFTVIIYQKDSEINLKITNPYKQATQATFHTV